MKSGTKGDFRVHLSCGFGLSKCFSGGLQGPHRPVKLGPHGMVPGQPYQQPPSPVHHVGSDAQEKKTQTLETGASQMPGQGKTAQAVEQVVGDQSGEEKGLAGPEILVSHGCGAKVVLGFLYDLLHHRSLVVQSPDIFRSQLLVGDHDLVASLHQLEKLHLGLLLHSD